MKRSTCGSDGSTRSQRPLASKTVSRLVTRPRLRASSSSAANGSPSSAGITSCPAAWSARPEYSRSASSSSAWSAPFAPGTWRKVRVPSEPTSATVAEVGVDGSRTTARRSTRRSSRSSRTKSPNRSAPTLPATAALSPSRESALAVFSAQPPPWSSISPASPSVPRAGSSSTGRQMTSATRIPRQTTSTPRSSHSPRDVVRFEPATTGGLMTLEGKVALVTGASRGIGAAVARKLDERSVKLGLASRSGDDLGLDAVAQPCDVRELDQLESIVAATVERFGRLDILVLNAGVGAYGRFLDLSLEHLEEMIDVNLKGTLYAVRAALPHLVESGAADIITIASEAGRRGLPYEATYCASKFGQVGFTRALDHELREHGVHCTNVCPGGVATDFALDEGRGRTPEALPGMMTAEDVAEVVLFVLTRPRNHRILETAFRPVTETSWG